MRDRIMVAGRLFTHECQAKTRWQLCHEKLTLMEKKSTRSSLADDMFATVSVDSYSFPSGHTTRMVMLAILAPHLGCPAVGRDGWDSVSEAAGTFA